MMTIAIPAAVVAVYLGVTLAALEQPSDDGTPPTRALSRGAVVAASVTGLVGVAYAIGEWLLTA